MRVFLTSSSTLIFPFERHNLNPMSDLYELHEQYDIIVILYIDLTFIQSLLAVYIIKSKLT